MLQQIAIEDITRVISLATAPAFLLGAVAALLSLLVGRLEAGLSDEITSNGSRGLRYIHHAINACVLSGMMTGAMIVMVFVSALFGANYSRGIILMFVLAVNLFMLSLALLWLYLRPSSLK